MGSKIIFILRFLFKKDQISQISENTWKPELNQFLSKLTFSCWFSTFSSSNFTFRYRWLLKRNHVSLTFLLCVLVSSSPCVLSWCFPRILCLSTSFLFDNRERVKEMGGVTDGGGVKSWSQGQLRSLLWTKWMQITVSSWEQRYEADAAADICRDQNWGLSGSVPRSTMYLEKKGQSSGNFLSKASENRHVNHIKMSN